MLGRLTTLTENLSVQSQAKVQNQSPRQDDKVPLSRYAEMNPGFRQRDSHDARLKTCSTMYLLDGELFAHPVKSMQRYLILSDVTLYTAKGLASLAKGPTKALATA